METSLMVTDYPEPEEEKMTTIKVNCYFESYVIVYGDDKEDWEKQINEMLYDELLEECDKIEIDSWEEIE